MNNIAKISMNYGAVIGLVMVVFSLIFYFLGILFTSSFQFFTYLIIVTGIYISCRKYRDDYLNGNIKYGKALGFGTLVIFFSSIIYGFYTYLIYLIEPELVNKYIDVVQESLQAKNMDTEQYETMINFYRMIISPVFLAFSEIFSRTILGFIFSLIVSIIIKKNGNSTIIQQNNNNINNN